MIFRKKNFFIFTLLATLATAPLPAEVQLVTLIWQPGLCNAKCIEGLSKQLLKMPGAAQVSMNQAEGRAFIVWKPTAPFSYQPINAAYRYIGIRVGDVRLKVKGKIIQSGSQLRLISDGDNTAFVLLNPLLPQPNAYVSPHNPAVRQLSPELAAALTETIKNRQTVVIEGEYFEPHRAPPNYLVVEKLDVLENPPKPGQAPRSR